MTVTTKTGFGCVIMLGTAESNSITPSTFLGIRIRLREWLVAPERKRKKPVAKQTANAPWASRVKPRQKNTSQRMETIKLVLLEINRLSP